MKYLLAALLILALHAPGIAQEYKPVDQGSLVEFVIKNFGLNTKGSFSGLNGKISFDPKEPAKSSFDVTIDANTVNTDNGMRDGHLKKEGYFDVEKYPRIHLVSTSIGAPDKSGHYTFNGQLTIKDKTKDISFPFIATPLGEDYIFKGNFSIKRRDFEVGGSSTISNDLTLNLTVVGKKQ